MRGQSPGQGKTIYTHEDNDKQKEPIRNKGGQSGRGHMREEQVTYNYRKVTFQNKTGGHETKPLQGDKVKNLGIHRFKSNSN